MNRRFTLNYGLRMGYHTQWFQRDRLASNFDPALFGAAFATVLFQPFCTSGTPAPGTKCPTANQRAQNPVTGALSTNTNLIGTFVPGVGNPLNGLALMSDPTTPAGFKNVQPIDFEPRVGFAWDVFGRGKTVLRAMGGVYHAPRTGGGTTGGNLVNNFPFLTNITLNNGNISQLSDPNFVTTAKLSPSSLNGVAVNADTPTTYNFSLGIQQDLGFKTVLEATYVGSQTRHLGERRNINGVPDGARFLDLNPQNQDPTTGTVKADNFLRPFPGWSTIDVVSYTGNSNYNGLQVQVNRWYAQKFQFGVAYTWSKTMDYANDDSSDVNFPRPYRAFNYGPSDFDQTQIFTSNYIWNLPSLSRFWNNGFIRGVFNGWQLSGITSLVSGKPKSIGTITYNCPTGVTCNLPGTVITDFTGGSVNARPNLVCDPNQVPDGATAAGGLPLLVNPACFAKPTTRGDIGNTPRNVLRLPGIITSDLALSKFIHLGERGLLQFRWETYNLFNHTNFKDIDNNLTFDSSGNQTNKSFGTPTSVLAPRVMQGSLRISF